MEWVNFGGGHHITRADYPVDALIKRIVEFQEKYAVQVYLEPGEAAVLHSGVLVTEVLDITFNEMALAILDTRRPAICRILWKCLIVPIFLMPGKRITKPLITASAAKPAWPAM